MKWPQLRRRRTPVVIRPRRDSECRWCEFTGFSLEVLFHEISEHQA